MKYNDTNTKVEPCYWLLTGNLDNKVVVPYGHNQGMKKETLQKNMLQGKQGNGHTSLSPLTF